MVVTWLVSGIVCPAFCTFRFLLIGKRFFNFVFLLGRRPSGLPLPSPPFFSVNGRICPSLQIREASHYQRQRSSGKRGGLYCLRRNRYVRKGRQGYAVRKLYLRRPDERRRGVNIVVVKQYEETNSCSRNFHCVGSSWGAQKSNYYYGSQQSHESFHGSRGSLFYSERPHKQTRYLSLDLTLKK